MPGLPSAQATSSRHPSAARSTESAPDEAEVDRKPASRLTAHFMASYSYTSPESPAESSQAGSDSGTSKAMRRSPRRLSAKTSLDSLGARPRAPPKWSVATKQAPSIESGKGKRKAEDESEAFGGVEGDAPLAASIKSEKVEDDAEPKPLDLPDLNDHLREDIDVMFVGINPGIRSSQTGHHFAHPSNHFYKALHLSGFTSERVSPTLDYTLLNNEPLRLGLTNLCSRPSRNASFLTREEKEAGSPILVAKIRRYRPLVAAFVGKGIGEDFAKTVKGKTKGSLVIRVPEDTPVGPLGLQTFAVAWEWDGPRAVKKEETGLSQSATCGKDGLVVQATLIFVMPSTSGLVTSHRISDKAECFAQARRLTEWLQRRADSDGRGPDKTDPLQDPPATKEVQLSLISLDAV